MCGYVGLLFLSAFFATLTSSLGYHIEYKEFDAAPNMEYSADITEGVQTMYRLATDHKVLNDNVSIRVDVSADARATVFCPVIFSVRLSQGVISWQVPTKVYKHPTNEPTFRAGRTLCLDQFSSENNSSITLEVTTCSKAPVGFTVKFAIASDMLLPLNKNVTVIASPTQPTFHRFKFHPNGSDVVFIRMDSPTNTCSIVSIQQPNCPLLSPENNKQFEGFWQTVTAQTGMTASRETFPDGFLIVFNVLDDDRRCNQYFGRVNSSVVKMESDPFPKPREKTFNFIIREEESLRDNYNPILIPAVLYILLVTVVLLIYWIFHRMRCGCCHVDNKVLSQRCLTIPISPNFLSPVYISDWQTVDSGKLRKKSRRFYWSIITNAAFYCVPVFQLIVNYMRVLNRTGEQDICYYNYLCAHPLGPLTDFNHIYSNVGYVILGITFIFLVRLRHKAMDKNFVERQNDLNDAAAAAASSASAEQTNDNVQHHACAIIIRDNTTTWSESAPSPSTSSTSFFGCATWTIFPRTDGRLNIGILMHYGTFYAMGLALIMEGCMSAAYHICPNQANFQFDMSFMYIIAMLSLVKIYQFRHPYYISANLTFVSIAIIACSTVFGLLSQSILFRILFSLGHAVVVFLLFVFLYYGGYIKLSGEYLVDFCEVIKIALTIWARRVGRALLLRKPYNRDEEIFGEHRVQIMELTYFRLILPCLLIVANTFSIAVIWTIMLNNNFATQVLFIFVVNVATYYAYYGIMKVIHNECQHQLWLQPLMYALLTTFLWIYAMQFFRVIVTSWETSAAESRVANQDCIVLGYYDQHDMWHFISAAGAFCCFMILLTVDDDLVNIPHSEIRVF